jgi:anti-anti-sigma regulatory factor
MEAIRQDFPNTQVPASDQLATVDLDAIDATQLARSLQGSPHHPELLVDCGRLKCLHTLGVSHVVSQLLVLHQAGANIWLRNVNPTLRRCLELLKVSHLFRALPTY